MEAAFDAIVEDLPLASVVEAWGVQTVEEVSAALLKGAEFLAVQDGGERARLFSADEVLKSPMDRMLDLLPGGREVLSVDIGMSVADLPSERPLLVREKGIIKGVLGGDKVFQASDARRAKRWAMPSGGANAQAAAMDAVKEVRDNFRREGVALVLDVQPSRVDGDGILVRDLVSQLLDHSLAVLRQNGGGTSVHLRVVETREGTVIEVQDRSARSQMMDADNILSDEPTSDLAIKALRKLHSQVLARRGRMEVKENRSGVLFSVLFPHQRLVLLG